MKERIVYYDVAKALAIFCVIIGDVYIIHDSRGLFAPVSTFVHTFHTALFMFISGIFFKNALNKNTKTIVKDKIRQLLIPYIFWSVFLLIIVQIPTNGFDNVGNTLESFIKGGFLKNYWYLKALFAYIIVSYFFIKIIGNDIIGIIASFLLFTFAPSFSNTALFIPYFFAGYIYGKYIDRIKHWEWQLMLIIVAIILYMFWRPEYNYNISESMQFIPYIIRTSIGIIDSILIITVLRLISKRINLGRLSNIGKYTLGMYCCNCFFYEGLIGFFWSKINIPQSLLCIFITVTTFFLSFLLCKLLDKNKFTSLLFLGNRLSINN